jgi:hypothetical protein
MSYHEPGGPVFAAAFSATALSTGNSELFTVTASSINRVVIREIRLGQHTEFGDAAAELFPLAIWTGSTAASTVGTAITPRNVASHSGAPTALTSVLGPSSVAGSSLSEILRLSDAWNVAAGWWWHPEPCERIVLNPGQVFALRQPSAAADALTLNGTILFQEIAKPAG